MAVNISSASVVFITPEPSTFAEEVLAVIRQTTAFLAVLVNGAIALAFLVQKCRRCSVQLSPAGLLVLNLLFADALVALVILRLSTHFTVKPKWCVLALGVCYMATIGSHIAVLNVVIDRFIAVTFTLQYREYMTMTKSVVMVCCGWSIPVAGLVTSFFLTSGTSSPVARCAEISTFRFFLEYVGVPSHVIIYLFVVVIQYSLYRCLRRHDAEKATSNQVFRRSTKAAWILFRITTPTYVAMLCYDIMLIVLAMSINEVVKLFHDVTLLFAQLCYLMNPLVYAYATANIRKPLSDLCADIAECLATSKEQSSTSPAPSQPKSRGSGTLTTTSI